jgi:transcriptional regulator with XRE-family HTH domain
MPSLADKLMRRLQALFEQSGLTLDELGQKMGYEGDVARQSAWQFLHNTTGARVTTLARFARAVDVPIADLFTGLNDKGRSK